MKSSRRMWAGSAALVAGVSAAALVAATGTAAADVTTTTAATGSGGVETQVRKSVSITADPSGEVQNSIMVTQVSSVGNGQTTVQVPIGSPSARNLDGFSPVTIENDTAIFDLSVDGSREERIYNSSSPGPVTVEARATLDGQPIEPAQIVNKTGLLEVTYTMRNTDTQTREITFQDAEGNEQTQTFEVDAPIGGSVEIVLPQGFNEVSAPGANIGGDGRGGTKLSFSPVLFRPLGNPVSSISYQTRITDGTLPQAVFTFLPIVPLENSTIKSTKEAYEGGIATGQQIFEAGVEIGDNLTKLQEGAGELMTGLITAVNGASQLQEGLVAAADGAGALESGLQQIRSQGTDQLASQLAAGIPAAQQLANETRTQLLPGVEQLNQGLEQLQAGVTNLSATVTGSAEYQAQMQMLAAALQGLIDYFDGIKAGATSLAAAASTIVTNPNPNFGNKTLRQVTLEGCVGAVVTAGGDPGTAPVICAGVWDAPGSVTTAMTGLENGLVGGLTQIIDTIENGSGGNPSPMAILSLLQMALPQVVPTILNQVSAQLLGTACGTQGQALNCIVDGVSGTLLPGVQELTAGVQGLPDSLQQAADGAAQIGDAVGQAADGAGQLATGLPAAADGAGQLATGLPDAVDGAGQIADGAGELRERGADELAKSGATAAAGFAEQVAQINAIQAAGLAGAGIPYGKATGPNTTTSGVFQMTLAAAQTPEENNALRYGLAVIALLVAAGLGAAVWRRRSV